MYEKRAITSLRRGRNTTTSVLKSLLFQIKTLIAILATLVAFSSIISIIRDLRYLDTDTARSGVRLITAPNTGSKTNEVSKEKSFENGSISRRTALVQAHILHHCGMPQTLRVVRYPMRRILYLTQALRTVQHQVGRHLVNLNSSL